MGALGPPTAPPELQIFDPPLDTPQHPNTLPPPVLPNILQVPETPFRLAPAVEGKVEESRPLLSTHWVPGTLSPGCII